MNIFRLFFGQSEINPWPLDITSIKIIKGALNLAIHIQAITAFDKLISNTLNFPSYDAELGFGPIIKELMNHYSSSSSRPKVFPQYIYDTFEALIAFKKKIEINIVRLHKTRPDKLLLQQLFDAEIVEEKDPENVDVFICDDNRQNMINPLLLKVFKNVEEIKIITKHHGPFWEKLPHYPLSLSLLLSIISKTAIKTATIVVNDKGGHFYLWQKGALSSMTTRYKQNGIKLVVKKDD